MRGGNKGRHTASADLVLLPRLRVASRTRDLVTRGERAEVRKLHIAPIKERQFDLAENRLDDLGGLLARQPKPVVEDFDKVLLGLPEENKRVTPQVVEDQIGVSKDFNGFELRDAIVNRNVYKANLIIKYFDENPKAGSIYAFLPLLFSYFQNLMIAHYCPQKNSQEALAEWLELRSPWAAREYVTGMKNYSAMKVLQIIGKLREMDAKSKGLDNPNTGPGDLMKELIFFILH